MLQLVKLGNCVHIFNQEQGRFVKRTAKNVRDCLRKAPTLQTKKQLIQQAQWTVCSKPRCKVRSCGEKRHLVALE